MNDFRDWNDWIAEVVRCLERQGVYAENLPHPWRRLANKLVSDHFRHLRHDYKRGASPEEAARWVLVCYTKHKESSDIVS